jgi:hypothetical protein
MNIEKRQPFAGRIRTAQLGSRDNRRTRRCPRAETGVSASASPRPIPKTPRNHGVLGDRAALRAPGLRGRRLEWRWGESRGNWSLEADPCYAGKVQGNPPISGSPERLGSEIPKRFRTDTVEFPAIGNREVVLMNREFGGIRDSVLASRKPSERTLRNPDPGSRGRPVNQSSSDSPSSSGDGS